MCCDSCVYDCVDGVSQFTATGIRTPRNGTWIAARMCLLLVLTCAAGFRVGVSEEPDSHVAAQDRLLQLLSVQGITSARVLDAMRETPRHLFVPPSLRDKAYYDMALPIGHGQTISPPFVVAGMTQQINSQLTDRVLEIGTGSGYQTAVLSRLAAEVYSIEIVEELGRAAARTLQMVGCSNVRTRIGDGFAGWPEYAPFDRIIVTCSPETIPKPLIDQLREGGRLIIPLGERFQQTLYLYSKVDGELRKRALEPTFFVPMTGRAEDVRAMKNDSGRPELRNGSFEDTAFGDLPAGWYYVRHGRVESDPLAPHGRRRMTFLNDVPGRWAQALHAVAVDGRRFGEMVVALHIRGHDVRSDSMGRQHFHAQVVFFGPNRESLAKGNMGPWYGTRNWTRQSAVFTVPAAARLCVLAIGLCGGTGELSFDQVEMHVVDRDGEHAPQTLQPESPENSN